MRYLLVAALFAAALPVVSWADEGTEDLKAEIKAQKDRLDKMEQKLQELEEHAADAAAHAKVKSEKSKKPKLTLEYSNGFKMSYKDPQTGNKRFAFQTKGRVMIDVKQRLSHNDRKLGSSKLNTFRKRRVRIGVKGTLYTYWHFAITLQAESGTVNNDNVAYIENTYIKQMKLRIGQFKVPFSLEENTSSKYVKLVERSMWTNFAAPAYEVGLMAYGSLADKVINYWVMVGNGNGTARSDVGDDKSLWGRLVLRPLAAQKDAPADIWIGVSGQYGIVDRQSTGSEHSSRVRTATGVTLMRYADGVVNDGEIWRLAGELGVTAGSFGAWAEYGTLQEELASVFSLDELELFNTRAVHWRGGHVTVAYFLTGEKMSLSRPKVLKPLEPGQPDSGYGAFELAARWDFIDNNLGSDTSGFFVRGDQAYRADQVMAGVNWYPNNMTRVSANWQYAIWNRDDQSQTPRNEHTLLLRVQLEF